MSDYRAFLEAKAALAPSSGFEIRDDEINPIMKPHAAAIVQWAVRGGRRAIFASFGLQKTVQQLEVVRLTMKYAGGRGLIVLPLGVRTEFVRDATMLATGNLPDGTPHPAITDAQRETLREWLARPGNTAPLPRFIRSHEDAGPEGIYLTNYESVREGKLDPTRFTVVSLDEAAILRGLGGVRTFREFMRYFEGSGTYRFVATATPDPNSFLELAAYAAFLDIMDVGQIKNRFFQRDSEKADNLTLMAHKAEEWWAFIASWAVFLTTPSDLGPEYSDEGYVLPPHAITWHELPSQHTHVEPERDGQQRLYRDASLGVVSASREKRESLPDRVAALLRLIPRDGEQFIVWVDLNDEQRAVERALDQLGISYASIDGSVSEDDREAEMEAWRRKERTAFIAKLVMYGSGVNLQQCALEFFLGIGFKFANVIQGVHRVLRFGQTRPVQIHLIHTEAERSVRAVLEGKWARHDEQMAIMTGLIREHGLASAALASALTRTLGVERVEVTGDGYRLILNDTVLETERLAREEPESVGLIVTSIPFGNQYAYTTSLHDLGYSENNAHFWQQMDYLTPNLYRVLQPGRICAIHVKDRITPSGLTGMGFQTVAPFHAEAIAHYTRHGFGYLGMKTITTDVVRENNQTYRLGWTEQCKDGSKMGVGMPEYVLLFRKPPTDRSNGYADVPVVKKKKWWQAGTDACAEGCPSWRDEECACGALERNAVGGHWDHPDGYSLGRWQIDAHGYARSDGNRALTSEELRELPHEQIYKLFKKFSLSTVYDYEAHVALCEEMTTHGRLPMTFMLMPPHSWHPDVWSDIARMRTLNMEQERKGREIHLCLARGSLVLTRERGYVPIEDVVVGERVLTHRGRWRPVVARQSTGRRPGIAIHAQGVPGLVLTPDHKIWARASGWVRGRDGAEWVEPAWIEAQHALAGYVNMKLPEMEPPSNVGIRHWWIVGRWLADGHWEVRGAAMISCGYHERHALLGVLGDRAGGVYDTGTALQVRVLDPDGTLKKTLRECGRGATGKHLPPEAVTLPIEQAAALLDGYLSGDGHLRVDRRRWMATSVSRPLLLGVAFLMQRVHSVIASVYRGRTARRNRIRGHEFNSKQEWVLSADLAGDRRKTPFILADGAWKKVRRLVNAGEVETYNLRVEEDESYTAEGCIVKNCPLQYDIVDRVIVQHSMPGEVVYDPFGGIFTVPYRALKLKRRAIACELSPGYFRDGVTYVEAAARQVDMPSLFDLIETDEEDHAP